MKHIFKYMFFIVLITLFISCDNKNNPAELRIGTYIGTINDSGSNINLTLKIESSKAILKFDPGSEYTSYIDGNDIGLNIIIFQRIVSPVLTYTYTVKFEDGKVNYYGPEQVTPTAQLIKVK